MLFSDFREPIFLKEDSELKRQLKELESIKLKASGETLDKINEDIKICKAGIIGEDRIHFELANSHIPMYVLHDITLEYNGIKAQIDYLIFCKGCIYIVECKNLYGNIEVNNKGEFIRTVRNGKRYEKKGMYSPITQNERHAALLKEIHLSNKNPVVKILAGKLFSSILRPVVVLANPETILNDRFATKAIKEKIIRADQLIEYIKAQESTVKVKLSKEDVYENAKYILGLDCLEIKDYAAKYDLSTEAVPIKMSEPSLICPKCGGDLIKRVAKSGVNAGKEFYGCSNYPKCRYILNIK